MCGRDARAPRKPSSHETVRPRARNCRSILAPLGVEGGPSVFWSIRVHWWFVFIKRLAIFSRMVRTRGRAITAHLSETKPVSLSNDPPRRGGRGPGLPETNACAWWLETGSSSSTGRFLIHIDAQDAQDFFLRRLACVPGHPQIRTRSSPESASPAAASRPDYPVHPVHRCSIYSPSRWIGPVAGGGRPARRQTGVSQRGQAGFQRSRPPDTPPPHHRDDPPGSAGVPPACCPFGCRSVSLRCCSRPPCRREPHGPGRSRGRAPLPVDSGGGDGRSCGEDLRAGRPRSRGGASSHDRVTPAGQKCRSILEPVVVEGGPSVLVPIRVHWWFVFIDERLFFL